jgi:hypothetical protein
MILHPKAFGLACGLVWGSGAFLLTWWLIVFEGITREPLFIGRVYLGYSISPAGSMIGLAWGFPDGLIAGAVLAFLYNFIVVRTSRETPHR